MEELVRRCTSRALATLDKGLPAAAAGNAALAAAAAAAAAAAGGGGAGGPGGAADVLLTRLVQDERDVRVRERVRGAEVAGMVPLCRASTGGLRAAHMWCTPLPTAPTTGLL
jgi:hypothetical protein